MEIIRTKNLSKTYQDNGVPVEALKDINLSIDKGEYVVIAGPSGSGKTTLLNLIGALDAPTTGKVFFMGENLSDKSKKELSEFRLNNLGFIFQAYNLIPVLTALENIEFSMMLKGIPEKERREKALELMNELGIGELANKRPNEMSGGQQQRVAVARAIVNNPGLVLADEPTANLDSNTANNLLDLMEKMNREKNITFIFSSHDQKVIDRAKRLIILKDGRIEEDSGK
ncbi:ABC-type transport system, ATPase component [Melioribacter roseus P3M-2]|uniref:ABC-type transport system, ATPase component n=1 Tax=Melioribacter roseus (strain DSM 23840 / JCM 17771 / VKM B-2668 / P3M-2) TaxID=1191523 RepID=I7A4V9_MELRP|nr:ABC transporter ATP-binding protein [Melioribacter roseus]AFN74901.1 ABC-type transport system, ATPase component [Melioribacter roseus P3M-2]